MKKIEYECERCEGVGAVDDEMTGDRFICPECHGSGYPKAIILEHGEVIITTSELKELRGFIATLQKENSYLRDGTAKVSREWTRICGENVSLKARMAAALQEYRETVRDGCRIVRILELLDPNYKEEEKA